MYRDDLGWEFDADDEILKNKIRPYIIGPMEILDTMDIMFRILNYMDTIHFIK